MKLGEMVDKLTIANMRVWALEQEIHDLKQSKNISQEEIQSKIGLLTEFNNQRQSLVERLNRGASQMLLGS